MGFLFGAVCRKADGPSGAHKAINVLTLNLQANNTVLSWSRTLTTTGIRLLQKIWLCCHRRVTFNVDQALVLVLRKRWPNCDGFFFTYPVYSKLEKRTRQRPRMYITKKVKFPRVSLKDKTHNVHSSDTGTSGSSLQGHGLITKSQTDTDHQQKMEITNTNSWSN